jgi:ribose-phosphate pyrophosphokinase
MVADVNGVVHDIAITEYADGAPLIKQRIDLNEARILFRPNSMKEFVAAMFWCDAMDERYDGYPHLVLPFVPGARQDRLNDEGDALFTLKSVAKMINERSFASVTVVDPHSYVTPALIDRCIVIPAVDCIQSYTRRIAGVVSPDAGAEKRASSIAKFFHVPLFHAWKSRDIETGAITGFGVEESISELRGKRVLVADDICDGGGTFVGLADQLDAHGVAADLYVTHGLFTQGTARLKSRFRHVWTTDSVLNNATGVDVMRVCERLLFQPSLKG